MALNDRCPGCGVEAVSGYGLCSHCHDSLQPLYSKISHSIPYIDDVYVAMSYVEPLRHWIHQWKFQGRRAWSKVFGDMLWDTVMKTDLHLREPLIIPVPLFRRSLRKRGFNQSQLLAQALTEHWPMVVGQQLVKTRHTKEQINLSAGERRHNLDHAFAVVEELPPVPILLLDDIYTTGSTIAACAQALYEGGAVAVDALVLAARR